MKTQKSPLLCGDFCPLGVIVITCLVLLCLAEQQAAQSGEGGKMAVYYTGAWYDSGLGHGFTSYVYLDQYEGPIGVALRSNHYHEFSVTPGIHCLIRHGQFGTQDSIRVDVKNGQTVYVESHPGVAHWNFEVSEDQARAKLRVSQLKPQR